MNYSDFCAKKYNEIYIEQYDKDKRSNNVQKERDAQRIAIRDTAIAAISKFTDAETSDLWRSIYEEHVNRKSGVNKKEIIEHVISADNSWKKSSGHAFEEMIMMLGNNALKDTNLKIYLQKDITILLKNDELSNEKQDLEWLESMIDGDVFDLFITLTKMDKKKFVFGCIQAKTSIRDRVTRDREPSLFAMDKFFWSIAIVLDGKFLSMNKFQKMVNGDGKDHSNGWHSLYSLSNVEDNDRIFYLDKTFRPFVFHASWMSKFWINNRQWVDRKWHPENQGA